MGNLLNSKFTKLTIFNYKTKEELAVVYDDDGDGYGIATANPDIVLKLTPKYDD